MNSQDKVAQLQRIISIAQDDLALLIKKCKRFKPKKSVNYFHVTCTGRKSKAEYMGGPCDQKRLNNFNCFETEELATKAAVMMKRNNAIIMACLTVDPDFVPDYLSGNQLHYSFKFDSPNGGWDGGWFYERSFCVNDGPCVSTEAKWHEAAVLLKEWGVE